MSNFTAPLDVRSLPAGQVALLRPLVWYTTDDPSRTVTVPLGFLTDGASIPRAVWPLIGHPLSSTVIRAAALHDWLYHARRIDRTVIGRARADREFRDALAVDGVGWLRRWTMWAAVRAAGAVPWSRPRTDRIDSRIAAEVWRVRHAVAENPT